MLKRTSLFEAHQKLGARLVEFGGWEMPVQYTSIMEEHQAVRTAAGMFDISHMGEVFVSGAASLGFLNWVLTNDIAKLGIGQGQYTMMCNERGGVVDDLYAYRLGDSKCLLIINASRIEEDWAWLQAKLREFPAQSDVKLQNVSTEFGALAIQGPKVVNFIDACFAGQSRGGTQVEKISALKKNQITEIESDQGSVWIARTGYTGEDGFEVVALSPAISVLWDRILKTGEGHGLKPCGLGARDTLRTEACYPLYGHELDENTSPLEAGLGYFVALEKPDFIGKTVLLQQKESGLHKKCVAFKMSEKSAPPRPHYPIWSREGQRLGEVVSGTQSPTLGMGIGLGYVPPEFAKPGTGIQIEIRGRRFAALIVAKPFYKKAV